MFELSGNKLGKSFFFLVMYFLLQHFYNLIFTVIIFRTYNILGHTVTGPWFWFCPSRCDKNNFLISRLWNWTTHVKSDWKVVLIWILILSKRKSLKWIFELLSRGLQKLSVKVWQKWTKMCYCKNWLKTFEIKILKSNINQKP